METIKQKFNAIMVLARQLETEPRKYGTDIMLTGVEIHLIELIGDNDNPSVTGLARRFGVTKGAVSQRLKKLEQKGLIIKNVDPSNTSRVMVSLTSKGYVAFYAHQHWHETMDGGFKAYVQNLDPEKIAIIDEFLTQVEAFFTKLAAAKQ
jgi:DNA-binding MarR family transcriptional regulator